ncbi:MAG: hypothetical protein ACYC26_07515 [Phycisphaerales bacterium]
MTSFNSSSYEIERTSGLCAITGRALQPGEEYYVALVEDGDLLKRLDICVQAWESDQRPASCFSYWKTTVPEHNQKKKVFVDDEVLMNLLRRLADADQPQRVAFRFVLMLILMRKKLLRYDRTEKKQLPGLLPGADGREIMQEWWLMTPKLDLSKGPLGKWNDQERFAVLDPHLDEEAMRQVTEQLGEVLNAEL